MQAFNMCGVHYDRSQGYGVHTTEFANALHQYGLPVKLTMPECIDWPYWLQKVADFDPTLLLLAIAQPHKLDFTRYAGRSWIFTMYEATRLPEKWPDLINNSIERVLVPCQWVKEVFEHNEIAVPIHVIPEGINPQKYPVIPIRDGKYYTFMALADRGARKNFSVVWAAFWDAFGDQPDVRLIVKGHPDSLGIYGLAGSDPRILVWDFIAPDMADVYAQADCFVFPSRGEGCGLPPREATAMGIPAIATNHSGLDDVENWGIPLNDFKMVSAEGYYADGGGGEWAKPDVGELAAKMRWCYEHRQKARDIALKGAQWLRNNWTWQHAASEFAKLLKKHTAVTDGINEYTTE